MSAVSGEERELYMADRIHPTQAGYPEWWTPKFESYLIVISETGIKIKRRIIIKTTGGSKAFYFSCIIAVSLAFAACFKRNS